MQGYGRAQDAVEEVGSARPKAILIYPYCAPCGAALWKKEGMHGRVRRQLVFLMFRPRNLRFLCLGPATWRMLGVRRSGRHKARFRSNRVRYPLGDGPEPTHHAGRRWRRDAPARTKGLLTCTRLDDHCSEVLRCSSLLGLPTQVLEEASGQWSSRPVVWVCAVHPAQPDDARRARLDVRCALR